VVAHEGRNAEMKTGVPVHMRLDPTMSELIIRLEPSYRRYQDNKRCITVLLN
jgi:hypothetical protein